MAYEHFQQPIGLNSRGQNSPSHHVGNLPGWRSLVSGTEIKRRAWHCLWMKYVHFSRAKIVLAGSEHITFWGNCHPRPSKNISQTEMKRRAWHRLWMKCRYHSSHAVENGTWGCETGYNSSLIAMQVPCNSVRHRPGYPAGLRAGYGLGLGQAQNFENQRAMGGPGLENLKTLFLSHMRFFW